MNSQKECDQNPQSEFFKVCMLFTYVDQTPFECSLKKEIFIYCCVCDTASALKDLYQRI